MWNKWSTTSLPANKYRYSRDTGHTFKGRVGVDGDFRLINTEWDDLRFPASGAKLNSAGGKVDFDFTNVGISFAANTSYVDDDDIVFIAQFSHGKKFDTAIKPHIHWAQTKDATPNLLLAYRWYVNGGLIPSFTLLTNHHNIYDYSSGILAQMTIFPDIEPPEGENVSSMMDIKLYRDSNNASGLFAGNDPYNVGGNTVWLMKEFDIHFEKDSVGSTELYTKSWEQ